MTTFNNHLGTLVCEALFCSSSVCKESLFSCLDQSTSEDETTSSELWPVACESTFAFHYHETCEANLELKTSFVLDWFCHRPVCQCNHSHQKGQHSLAKDLTFSRLALFSAEALHLLFEAVDLTKSYTNKHKQTEVFFVSIYLTLTVIVRLITKTANKATTLIETDWSDQSWTWTLQQRNKTAKVPHGLLDLVTRFC